MASAYARWILSTRSRSTLKMQGFEPWIDLESENVFFEELSPLIEVVTGPCENAVIRAGDHLRGIL